MKRTPRCLVLSLGLVLAPWAGTAQAPAQDVDRSGTLRGTVFGQSGSRLAPLPNALVFLTGGGRYLTLTADSAGLYYAAGLSSGIWRLKALHVGYEAVTAEVRIPPRGIVTLDLELEWKPVSLPALTVRADPLRPLRGADRAPSGELAEVAIRALEGTSGMVEGGLTQMVQSLPGNDPADPQDVLLMRGSAADLKLVLLDGAPVYTPFHMAGLVESFDPRALGTAQLFLGGAPARFDGGLSYILDLQTREPGMDRVRGSASLDLLTGRALLEGPFSPSGGFLLASRAIHNLGTPILSGGSSPYGYADVLGRLSLRGEGGGSAYLTGFWNEESVVLDLLSDAANSRAEDTDSGTLGFLGNSSMGEGARWGNRALAGGLRGMMGETAGELRIAVSRYDAELPVGDTLPLFAQSRSDRFRVTADFSRPWGEGAVRFGGSLDRQASKYSAMVLDSAQAPAITSLDLKGGTGGAYLEGNRPLTQSVQVRGGMRLDHFGEGFGVKASPRLSLTWMLTDDAALTLAAGRYHQLSNLAPEEVEKSLEPDPPGESRTDEPLELAVGAASHLVISLDQTLTPGLKLGLEGFVKEFSGLMGEGGEKLHASGVDLRVVREGARAAGWLGYTLTWFWVSDGILSSGQSPFSGRHLLSAGLTAHLSERTGLEIRTSYGDGLPYTSVPVFGLQEPQGGAYAPDMVNFENADDRILNQAPELTVGPDEGFFRLDVELYTLWSPTVSGRAMELRPYVRVLNALNRRDALFYHFDPWRSGGPEPLADLPLLPLVGLEWRF